MGVEATHLKFRCNDHVDETTETVSHYTWKTGLLCVFLFFVHYLKAFKVKQLLRSPCGRCNRLGILRQESTSNPKSQTWAHDEAWGKTVPMRCVTVQLTLYSFPQKLCSPWCFWRWRRLKSEHAKKSRSLIGGFCNFPANQGTNFCLFSRNSESLSQINSSNLSK